MLTLIKRMVISGTGLLIKLLYINTETDMEWLKQIDEAELQYMAPSLFVFTEDLETAASLMYKEGMASPMASYEAKAKAIGRAQKELESRPPKKYWEAVKVEFRILICTEDEKYSNLRKKLALEYQKGTKSAVALISALIGSILGVKATLLVGFCAVVLYGVLKVGKEAYCSTTNA